MKTSKSLLLDQFINENVYITTDLHSVVQMPEGEVVEAPLIIEGVMLDYDASYLLIGQLGRDSLELIRRDKVVGIKQAITLADEVMEDPDKPNKNEMC